TSIEHSRGTVHGQASDRTAGAVTHSAPSAQPPVFVGDRVRTVPNGVTVVRTVGAVVVAGLALAWAVPWMLVVAYGIYWVGDMLDGFLARRLGQETRLGAVLDIVSDRACTSVLCSGVVVTYPEFTVVVIPFFVSF